jgi:c-di-GMP phosphodiesterase
MSQITETTVEPRPRRERTPAQKEASRRNGAKSRGPKRAKEADKAQSSGNSPAPEPMQSLFIYPEEEEVYETYRDSFLRFFRPRGGPELELVEQIAVSAYRRARCLHILTGSIGKSMRDLRRNRIPGLFDPSNDPVAHAYERLADSSRVIRDVLAEESFVDRQYHRSLRSLLLIQQARRDGLWGGNPPPEKKSEEKPENPITPSNETASPPSGSPDPGPPEPAPEPAPSPSRLGSPRLKFPPGPADGEDVRTSASGTLTATHTLAAVCVGRQPIFDARRKVMAYELLFRRPAGEHADFLDGDEATAQVILCAAAEIGLDKLAGAEPVFLNCTRRFLEEEPVLPPDKCVLEVLEDIAVDNSLLASLRRLKERGYRLALDDFVYRAELKRLVELADCVKVDVSVHSPAELRRQVDLLRPFRATLLAEKVDSEEQLNFCRTLGFDLFQGYFLRRPESVAATRLATSQIAAVKLLSLCQQPDANLAAVARLVATDVALSAKVVQIANSGLFGRTSPVRTIPAAVSMMGTRVLQRWAALLLMAGCSMCPPSYVGHAVHRARMSELIAPIKGSDPDQAYLVGLFSILDSAFGAPLESILDQLPLPGEIREALLNRTGNLGHILAATIAYEHGHWDEALALSFPAEVLRHAFWEAAAYARSAEAVLMPASGS